MWELGHKEGWVVKNGGFQIVVLEKILESSLDCKEITSVNPKGNQPWLFIGRTDAEAETPILWPPDVKSWLTGKDPDAGIDWERLKGKGEEGGAESSERWLRDGWPVAMPQHTWIWPNSGREWRTEEPGVLQSTGSQSRTWLNKRTISTGLPDFSIKHQILFQWVSSSHQVAKGLDLQLQHQTFQWIFRVDFL